MADVIAPVTVNTITELKTRPVMADTIVLVVGAVTIGDNKGGFFQWQAAATGADDTTNYNTIISSVTGTGRWVRIFTRNRVLPHGMLVQLGSFKSFYAAGTTDANSEVALNLTDDNTTNGTPLFSSVMFFDSIGTNAAVNTTDVIVGRKKSLSANLKQMVFGFHKPSPPQLLNLTIITGSLTLGPTVATGAGIPVQMRVDGI